MSKKKAFTGNTMTLKDFHGGSIPSDLSLPSAPGAAVKPSDRPGYDRSASWGGSIGGRPDHRSRPNSSQGSRHFDDKAPFLGHSPHIGRNFDEDERTPLDGVSAQRRVVSDESVQAPPIRVEAKTEAVGRVSGWQGMAPLTSGTGGSYSGRVADGSHVRLSSPNSGRAVSRQYPNAWAARKEVVVEPAPPVWSQESAVSKLAHASALEKVSSGRWQTKQSVHYQADVEIVTRSEPEIESGIGVYSKVDVNRGFNRVDGAMLASHAERNLNIQNGARDGRKESPDNERAKTPTINNDRLQSVLHSDRQTDVVPLKPLERPKLNLLPRKEPLESPELPILDHHQGYQRPDSSHAETKHESNQNVTVGKQSLAGTDSGTQVVARPKLNLKPRSHPIEKHQEKIESGRNALFGGARPREMVLKERGIDDVLVSNNDKLQDSDRTRHTDTTENAHEKKPERKDHQPDGEKLDMQRKNRRNSGKDTERQPSPETWRKPDEQKPSSPDSGSVRHHGKAASALELAQAFSRSVSGDRVVSGGAQKPFSRLTGTTTTTTRPQINGY